MRNCECELFGINIVCSLIAYCCAIHYDETRGQLCFPKLKSAGFDYVVHHVKGFPVWRNSQYCIKSIFYAYLVRQAIEQVHHKTLISYFMEHQFREMRIV